MDAIVGFIGILCVLCYLHVKLSLAECQAALGVADNDIIRNSQMSASSQKGGHKAEDGRLGGNTAWRPDMNRVEGEWIQVEFDTLVKVTKIATQGRNPDNGSGSNEDEYVTSYNIQYSNDGQSWMYIRNAVDDNDRIFNGNEDRGSTMTQTVDDGVILKYIRIEMVECSTRGCALRLELYGCEVPVCNELDPPSNGHLLDTAVVTTGSQEIGCNRGFAPMGPTSTMCTAMENRNVWMPDISSTCVPVCAVLKAPANGYLTNRAEPFTNGDKQTIECNDGFTRMGATASIVCTAAPNGDSARWRPIPSSITCVLNKPASTTTSPPSISSIGFDTRKGGRRSNAGAIAGYVIGILALLVIIIVAVLWLLKRKRQTETSTPKTGQAFDGPYELTIEGTVGPQAVVGTGLADGKKDPDDNVYQDVRDKANNDNHEYTYVQEGAKKSTGDIYHDIKDKPDDYAYAYADVNAGKTADASPNDVGLVDIYAKSRHGGRPTTGGKQNPVADDDAGDIYQAVDEDPNENEYAYADVKVANDNREPAKEEEGWEDNVIYATDGGDSAADTNKGEGWVDNNIYATTDNDEQNAAGKSQVEGWEDNIIYGDK